MLKKIRLTNLRLLAFEYVSQGNLAITLKIEHSELIKYFNNKHTSISDDFARNIEETLNKPLGWMDRKNYDLALTEEESILLTMYRGGTNRDRQLISALVKQIHQMQ